MNKLDKGRKVSPDLILGVDINVISLSSTDNNVGFTNLFTSIVDSICPSTFEHLT